MASLLPLLFLTGMAQAQTNIIYQDSFARTGMLNGTAPDVVDTGGAVWYATTNVADNNVVNTDGSEIAITNANGAGTDGFGNNGYLPFTPVVGHKYTLTVTTVGLTGGNQWLALGFSQTEATNNYYAGATVGAGWLLVRASGANYQPFPGPGTANGTTVNLNSAATNAFQIVLDTTTGNAGAGWTVTFSCNGVQGYQFIYSAVNPGIHFVGCGEDGATGYFRNYMLTDYAAPPTAPVITETPQNVTAGVGQTATLWVNANGAPTPACQWFTNGVGGPTNAIVGATNYTYTTPPLTVALYNGLQYSVLLTNISGSTNSAPATLTVVNLNPTVYSAEKGADVTHAVVVFSEAVDPTTGLNAANYTVNNGVTVNSASYGSMSNSIILTTSTQNTNFLYKLTVQNVKDLFGNTVANTTVPLLPAGLAVYLRADSGIVLDNFGSVAEWIDQTTNGNNVVQYIGGNIDRPTPSTMNSASAVSFSSSPGNYLTAASSLSLAITNSMTIYAVVNFSDLSAPREILSKSVGSVPSPYDYFVNASTGTEALTRGNGQSLGTFTSTAGASAGVAQVLAVTGSTNTGTVTHYLNGIPNGSGTLTVAGPSSILDLGHPLFIGGRGDLQQWMNGTIGEVMIYNGILSAADRTNVDNYLGTKYCNYAITTDLPSTLTTSNGYAVTYIFAAGQGSAHLRYQWQENGTNIPGATSQSYTTPILAPGDNGDTFDVQVTFFDGSTTYSTTNTLTVLNQPPYVTSAGIPIWNTNSIVVFFDEAAVDPATATTAANYSLNNGATVLSATMGDAPNKVVLTTSPLTWSANPGFYALTVQNVQDVYGNAMVTASPSVGLYPSATALWVRASIGVTTNADGTVSQWNDLSGLGNNLFAFNSVSEPQLVANAHGEQVVHFIGTNGSYGNILYANDAPSLEITSNMSIFAVIKFAIGGGTNGEIVSKTGSSSDTPPHGNQPGPFDYNCGASSINYLRGNGTGVNANFTSSTAPSVGWTHLLDVVQAGTTVTHRLDGNTNRTGTLSTTILDAGQPLYVGARADLFNRLTGDIVELIVMGSAISSNDVASMESYLATGHTVPIGTNTYPAITRQPVASTNVNQNATLTVPAAASGTPQVAYQWYDTNNIAAAGQTNATLVIGNIQTSNNYYVVATNVYGAVTSSVVAVTVISGLNVSLGPPSVTLYAGQSFTFNARASGSVPFYYQWYQGASPIPNATNAGYTAVATLGSTSYSCTVTNPYAGLSSTNAGPVALIGIAAPTNLYQATVLGNQPVAYWRLTEGPNNGLGNNGTIANDFVGGHNAIYTNTPLGYPGFSSLSSTDTAALFGTYATTNTYAGEINQSSSGLANINFAQPAGGNAELSVEAWINSTNTTQIGGATIVAKGSGGGGEQFVMDMAGNAVRFLVRDYAGGLHGPSSALVPVVGQWYHYVGVWDGSNGVARLYINGVDTIDTTGVTNGSGLLVSTTTNTALPNGALVSIGARTSSQAANVHDLQFKGLINDVAIYNYPLTPAQVLADYVAGAKDAVFSTSPTNILFSTSKVVSTNYLTLTWPLNHWGWHLQAQTNNLSAGLGTNWVNVGGSGGTNQVIVPVSVTSGSVFYRLVYP